MSIKSAVLHLILVSGLISHIVARQVSVDLVKKSYNRSRHTNSMAIGQDCNQLVQTFPVCVDPTANMYEWSSSYFCCAQGATGVIPNGGYPFCQTGDLSVPVSLLATMVCLNLLHLSYNGA